MPDFNERKKAAENKFVMDKDLEFKAEAKRNKALGNWAGTLLGKNAGEEMEKYALSVIMADMEEPGDEDVFRKLRKDLTEGNVEISDAAIRDKMAECLEAAREEVYGA